MSFKMRVFVVLVAALGFVQLVASSMSWRSFANNEFLLYFAAAALSSLFPLKRAGNGISLSLPFVLLSIVYLSSPEAVVIGCTSVLIQTLRTSTTRVVGYQLVVAVAIQAVVIATAKFALESILPQSLDSITIRALVGAPALFIANTLPVAMAVRLSEKERIGKVWRKSYFWSFPYYLVSGALAVVVDRSRDVISLGDGLLMLTTVFLAYRYYRHQKAELDTQREHASQMAALHIRAIEGLALAVEAKDNLNTRGHLRRVQVNSLAIGKAIGLNETEQQALHAGALLHDIGKLAVPDHILTKPGKLTPEEFAKMKVHPLVGAEIVEQMQFPYPVAPIVREHHEKWNGEGYPFGLKGEEISLGARILAVVDCLDALTSDREYRKGIPVDQAMEYIASESEKSFDPKVVEALSHLHTSLDQQPDSVFEGMLSTEAEIEKGAAPDAGLDLFSSPRGGTDAPSFLSAIAAARREENLLRKMASSVAVLEMHEVLPRIHRVLQGMVPYDALAFFVREANSLRLEYSTGVGSEDLSYLEIPMGEGMTGWVAQNRQALVNGNPSVDPGFSCDSTDELKSALAIPLEGSQDLIGVLTLYRVEKDAFTRDELRILNAVTTNIALALENALKYRESQLRAKIDPVTGLPGTDLFLQAVGLELARARRKQESLCVLSVEVSGFQDITQKLGKSRTDEMLAALGSGMKSACREFDRIARVGTATFAVALPGMKANHLSTILDRIEDRAAQGLSDDPVSFSIGGAFYPEDGDGARHMLAVAHRRARSGQPNWTQSIRALTYSVGQLSPSEEKSPNPIGRPAQAN